MAGTTEQVFNFGSVDMAESWRSDPTVAELDTREFPLAECVDSHPDHPFRPLAELGFEQVAIGGDVEDSGDPHLYVFASVPLTWPEQPFVRDDKEGREIPGYRLEVNYDGDGTRKAFIFPPESDREEVPAAAIEDAAWEALEALHDSLVGSLIMPEAAESAGRADVEVDGDG